MRSGPEPEVRPPYSVTFPAGRPAPEGYSVMLLPGGSGEAAKVGPFGAAPAGAPPGSARGRAARAGAGQLGGPGALGWQRRGAGGCPEVGCQGQGGGDAASHGRNGRR